MGLPAGAVEFIVQTVKFLDRFRFTVEGLDDGMAAIHFFNMAVDVTEVNLLLFKVFLGGFDDHGDKPERNRQDYYRHQRHQPADGQHHHKDTDNHRHRCHNLRQVLGQGIADGIDIIGDQTQGFTVGFGIKVLERHPFDFFRNIFPEIIGDLHRDAGHDIALDETEDGAGYIQT